VLDG